MVPIFCTCSQLPVFGYLFPPTQSSASPSSARWSPLFSWPSYRPFPKSPRQAGLAEPLPPLLWTLTSTVSAWMSSTPKARKHFPQLCQQLVKRNWFLFIKTSEWIDTDLGIPYTQLNLRQFREENIKGVFIQSWSGAVCIWGEAFWTL